jgi:hypothetical protein
VIVIDDWLECVYPSHEIDIIRNGDAFEIESPGCDKKRETKILSDVCTFSPDTKDKKYDCHEVSDDPESFFLCDDKEIYI